MMKGFLYWRFVTLIYKLLGIAFIVGYNKDCALALSDCNATKGLIFCPTTGKCLTRDQFCNNAKSCKMLPSNIDCSTIVSPKYLPQSLSENSFFNKILNNTHNNTYLQGRKQSDIKNILRNKALIYLKYPELISKKINSKQYKLPMLHLQFPNNSILISQENHKSYLLNHKMLLNINKPLPRTLVKQNETSLESKGMLLPRVRSTNFKNILAFKTSPKKMYSNLSARQKSISPLDEKFRRLKRQKKISSNNDSTANETKKVDSSLVLGETTIVQQNNQTMFRPLLNCNEAGLDVPHKWSSHKYCPCKKFVRGKLCDRCDRQSFYLSKENKHGCLKCFCMNLSRSCKSSSLKRRKIVLKKYSCNKNIYVDDHNKTEVVKLKKEVSCHLPDQFVGDRITSYGGVLRFRAKNMREKSTIKVFLKNDRLILEHKVKKRFKRGRILVKMKEDEWLVKISEKKYRIATRSEFLLTLSDLQAVYVEGRKIKRRRRVILKGITLDTANNVSKKGKLALQVEQCVCPVGYTGASCHLCAPGYQKKTVEPFNPDGLYFVCHKKKQKEANSMENLLKSLKSLKITFMLETQRETNVLSFNVSKHLLQSKGKPVKLYMVRNNSITFLRPYKEAPLDPGSIK